MKDRIDRKFGCFEVFGFDFMLDNKLNPYLLEVNMNPAMFLDTLTMEEMLPKLIKDVCTLAVEIHKPYARESSSEVIRNLI
jgi:D-alanine-D-alanine ligase-like ATP-grasp enzyme